MESRIPGFKDEKLIVSLALLTMQPVIIYYPFFHSIIFILHFKAFSLDPLNPRPLESLFFLLLHQLAWVKCFPEGLTDEYQQDQGSDKHCKC